MQQQQRTMVAPGISVHFYAWYEQFLITEEAACCAQVIGSEALSRLLLLCHTHPVTHACMACHVFVLRPHGMYMCICSAVFPCPMLSCRDPAHLQGKDAGRMQQQQPVRAQTTNHAFYTAWDQMMEQKIQDLKEKLAARDDLFAFMKPVAQHGGLMTLGRFINKFKVEVVSQAGAHPPGTPEEELLAAWPEVYERAKGEGKAAQASLQPI